MTSLFARTFDWLDRRSAEQLLGLAALGIFVVWLVVGLGLSTVHHAWCRSQFAVATTHADTVSAVQWCGVPQ